MRVAPRVRVCSCVCVMCVLRLSRRLPGTLSFLYVKKERVVLVGL